jgi:hypothetical protein
LGITGKWKLADEIFGERGEGSFCKANAPVPTADHSVATKDSTVANDRSQPHEGVVGTLASRKVDQLVAYIEAPSHVLPNRYVSHRFAALQLVQLY